MKLQRVRIPTNIASDNLPREAMRWIEFSSENVQRFWDRYPDRKSPEWTESDFEYVAHHLWFCREQELFGSGAFLEWGCGFAVVAGLAARFGMSAVGIEVEPFLCQAAREMQASYASAQREDSRHEDLPNGHGGSGLSPFAATEIDSDVEIWQGSFLPMGSEKLAEPSDPRIALAHGSDDLYGAMGRSLKEFGAIFCYAWPGEEHFLKSVFAKFARVGSLLLLHKGPNELELYRNATDS